MNKDWYNNITKKNNFKLNYIKSKYKYNVNELFLKVCYLESAIELNLLNDKNISINIEKLINLVNNNNITLSYLEGLSDKLIYKCRTRQLFTGVHPKVFGDWNNIQELIK